MWYTLTVARFYVKESATPHKYVITKQLYDSRTRESFFCNGVVNIWDNLPDSTDFTTLSKFDTSVKNDYLLKYKISFT